MGCAEILRQIILKAFVDAASFDMFLQDELKKPPLAIFAAGATFEERIYNMIRVAEAEGWTRDLIAALQARRPNLAAKLQPIAEGLAAGHSLDNLPAPMVAERSPDVSVSAPTVAIVQITDMDRNKDDAWSAIVDLYHKRLPEDERYPNGVLFNLIRDHLRRDFGPRRPSAYWKAYFIVAKFGQQVVGMLLAYNYDDGQSDFLYIPYLVVAKGLPKEADPRTIGRKLIDKLVPIATGENNGNRICFITEVDDPATTKNPKDKCRRRARIELFDTISHIAQFELRCLDFKFLQPKLTLSDIGNEEELLILYGAKISPKFLARDEVVRILTWFYKQLYSANMFTEPDEDEEYQRYLDQLLNKATQAIPVQVRLQKLEPFYRGAGSETSSERAEEDDNEDVQI